MTEKPTELLPCAFCGGEPETKTWRINDIVQIKIWCDAPHCLVHPSIFGNKQSMTEAWNTRADIHDAGIKVVGIPNDMERQISDILFNQLKRSIEILKQARGTLEKISKTPDLPNPDRYADWENCMKWSAHDAKSALAEIDKFLEETK